jgi:hypothetical protein
MCSGSGILARMAPYTRPVQAKDMLASAEMTLHHPNEVEVERRGANEGEGVAFDNSSPSALAERIFAAPGIDLQDLLAWYEKQLLDLGWRLRPLGRDEERRVLERDSDEMIQVQILPLQETEFWSWSAHYGRAGPFARITYMVEGDWPSTP